MVELSKAWEVYVQRSFTANIRLIILGVKANEFERFFKYFGSMLTEEGLCSCELKSRIAMAIAAFNNRKNLYTSKLVLNLRKKLLKCYVWGTALYGAENLDAPGNRSETPGKFRNVVLVKDGGDHVD
jgi:hypothetical protein